MDLQLYLALVIATTIMILIPGPSVMLTVGHALSYGLRASLATVAGATTGVGLQVAVALAGMTSLMLFLADWFELIRWAGVAYLVYLGVKTWRQPVTVDATDDALPASNGRSLFLQGLIVTIPNPKSLIFLAAFLPQFIDPAADPVLQAGVIGVTFLVIAFVFTAFWALIADRARRLFRSPRAARLRNRVTGGLFIGAGLGLALARRG